MTADPRRACLGSDTELWFRDREIGPEARDATALALETCRRCVVRLECIETALVEEERSGRASRWGIRGGLTGLERYNLAVRRRKHAAKSTS
ncbi:MULTISPECIES: WhiB family transcriptional regulator [Streptomyces]|uniref:WhiB family transcriptional regulator n=1 Tax=Streptomyces flavovirens TaxID=52258 RepID=A0ABV8ND56_9ACTN|nr:WhiB family transcriptional regulator [Streptomyces sp. MBT51]MBK3595776.1 WhiB family transcriptional regulator [Streptomyces sp. MBT51]